ncbi:MAG: hypothetical protein O3A00_21765 [Planctomycetota bacterium]|nr:hypothetical protein [Planctomycetota bacterium]
MLKVHRWPYTFEPELKAYQRLAEHNVFRLKGFNIPRLLDYDAELHILELSFVTPPYILDFVGANPGRKPASFNLDRIEFEFSRQFGSDWPEVRLLLEALMHLGIYYEDAHNKNIRLR